MFVVTKLDYKKDKKRVDVYLDGIYSFSLNLITYASYKLKVGQELSEDKIREIRKDSQKEKIYQNLLKFVSLRPRSKKEVEWWFAKKKIRPKSKVYLLDKLQSLDLIDDYKFAQWWIKQRLEFKFKSKKEIFLELRVKGVDKDVIEDVFAKFDFNEQEIIFELLKKKEYLWKRYSGRILEKKKKDYLLRRGFSWDVVERSVKG